MSCDALPGRFTPMGRRIAGEEEAKPLEAEGWGAKSGTRMILKVRGSSVLPFATMVHNP